MLKDSEERKKAVNISLAINSLDGAEPSKECMALLDDYIGGRSTVQDIVETLKILYTQL